MARKSGKARQRERKRKHAAAAGLPDAAEIERRLDKAFHLIDAGELGDAARRLAGLARQVPRHAEIRHALGYVRHLQGRDDASVEELTRAIDLDPRCGSYRNSLAVVLHKTGQFAEAAEQGRAAVDREPGNPAFQFNLGNALKDSGAFAEAVDCYRTALSGHPDDPEILNNLGVALTRADQATEAVALFRRAAALRPDDPQIPYNLGLAHQELGDEEAAFAGFNASLEVDDTYDPAVAATAALHMKRGAIAKAIAIYRHYLQLRPDDYLAMRALAELLRSTGKFDEARRWVTRIGELAPDDPCVARVLAGILTEQDDVDGAIAVLRRVLDTMPGETEAWLDLGRIYILLERFDEAMHCIERAAELEPDSSRLFHLRSLMAEAEGDLAAAGTLQDQCLDRDPDNYMMRAHRGRLHLTAGELEPGFALYEARLEADGNAVDELLAPLWQGEPLEGKKLLIAAEQGVGDEIIFGSCIPDVIDKAASCAIECDPRLVSLFQRSFPNARIQPSQKSVDNRFNIRSYSWLSGDAKPDYAVSLGSLAKWCRPSIDDFPQPGGYLKVDPERVAYWRRRLDALGPGLKVGLCWRSSLAGLERSRFYTGIEDWAPLFTAPGVVPVNLQYDDCRAELEQVRSEFGAVIHTMPDLDLYNDFENMAAMMRALDVVVSVSTIMPYLAAATGQKAFGVSVGRDWSFLGTDRYPWLPDLEPFIRQPGEDWSVVIGEVTRRIAEMAAEAAAARAA